MNLAPAQMITLDPDCPSPQQLIRVGAYAGGPIWTIGPALTVVTQNNEIRITHVVALSGFVMPPAGPVETVIGPFAEGIYVVKAIGRELASSGGYGPEVPIASREFKVQSNPPACTPASIELSSPSFQSAVVQQPFPQAVTVRVLDSQGRTVPGVTVTFELFGGDTSTNNPQTPTASFGQSQVATDNAGVATTTVVAGPTSGVAQYRARFTRGNQIFAAYFVLVNRHSSAAVEEAVPVVEFYNSVLGHYFITANEAEQRALDTGVLRNWSRTGYVFLAPTGQAGSSPVCRLYGLPSAGLDSHFYSADPSECDAVLQRWPNQWVLETREAFRSYLPDLLTGTCASSRVAVYRLYNNEADANHRYTTSASVKALMRASGWIPEGYGPEGTVLCAPL